MLHGGAVHHRCLIIMVVLLVTRCRDRRVQIEVVYRIFAVHTLVQTSVTVVLAFLSRPDVTVIRRGRRGHCLIRTLRGALLEAIAYRFCFQHFSISPI